MNTINIITLIISIVNIITLVLLYKQIIKHYINTSGTILEQNVYLDNNINNKLNIIRQDIHELNTSKTINNNNNINVN